MQTTGQDSLERRLAINFNNLSFSQNRRPLKSEKISYFSTYQNNMAERMSISKLFINLLYGTGQAAVNYYIFCNDLKRWGYHYESARESRALYKRLQNKQYANKLLHNLKRSKYIKVSSIGHNLIVTLTNEGKMIALRQKIRDATKLTNTYTVVIFDIPEVKRLVRNLFRHLLKESNFVMLQQSVWVSGYDAKAILIQFIKEQKIQNWVNVFYAKDFFNLPAKLLSHKTDGR